MGAAGVEELLLHGEGHHAAEEVIRVPEPLAHGVGFQQGCQRGGGLVELAERAGPDAGEADVGRPFLGDQTVAGLRQADGVCGTAVPVRDQGLQSTDPDAQAVVTGEFAAHVGGADLGLRGRVPAQIEAGVGQDPAEDTRRRVKVAGLAGGLSTLQLLEDPVAQGPYLFEQGAYGPVGVGGDDPPEVGLQLFHGVRSDVAGLDTGREVGGFLGCCRHGVLHRGRLFRTAFSSTDCCGGFFGCSGRREEHLHTEGPEEVGQHSPRLTTGQSSHIVVGPPHELALLDGDRGQGCRPLQRGKVSRRLSKRGRNRS